MAERQITIEEACIANRLSASLADASAARTRQQFQTSREDYEAWIDRLIELARPHLLAVAPPTIPSTPPASLSPDAAGGAAGPIPPGGAPSFEAVEAGGCAPPIVATLADALSDQGRPE